MKVLDSTFLIDVIKGNKDTLKVIRENETFATTQINMYEIIKGMYLKGLSEEKIQSILEMFENIKILSLDDSGVKKSAEIFSDLIKKGEELPNEDCMIAGIMLSKGVTTIVTRNKKDFSKIKGLKVEGY